MITYSIARVARSANCSTSSLLASPVAATCCSAYQFTVQSSKRHQRRHSSSKASVPPNGTPRSRSSAPSQQAASAAGRVRGKKAKAAILQADFSHLPSVPSTEHLHPSDINVSSFFSMHRPISLTQSFPAITTFASFSGIFDSKQSSIRRQSNKVIDTVGSAVQRLEQSGAGSFLEESDFDNIQDTRGQVANDPRDVMASKMGLPFVPPPVPEPLSTKSKSTKRAKRASKPRSWKTTITVTEHTNSAGKKVYTAASTPLERIQSMIQHNEPVIEQVVVGEPIVGNVPVVPVQPFLHRLHKRHGVWEKARREEMMAISVKRQRKLKMKKHKYKKLMKRTRNLRRKLGKL